MPHYPFFLRAVVAAAMACATCFVHAQNNLAGPIAALRQYADSFKGLGIDDAKRRLQGAKLVQDEWKESGFSGPQLVATFPTHEVRVLFLGGSAITTSIQVLSD